MFYKSAVARAFSLLTILALCQLAFAEQQVSQFGITWTFDRDYQTGRFANSVVVDSRRTSRESHRPRRDIDIIENMKF